jgi:hypothetical protein
MALESSVAFHGLPGSQAEISLGKVPLAIWIVGLAQHGRRPDGAFGVKQTPVHSVSWLAGRLVTRSRLCFFPWSLCLDDFGQEHKTETRIL